MEGKEAKKQKQKHPNEPQQRKQQPAAAAAPPQPKPSKSERDPHFKPSSDVKGVRFGGQFIVKSFTVRRAAALELPRLLAVPLAPSSQEEQQQQQRGLLPFPSTTTYLPTNFTILAHEAWHTLTLGLGTRKSKILLFVFESEGMKSAVDGVWPAVIPLGEVNRKLVRGLAGCEMARFKFRKGALTFYVYAVRRAGAAGFSRAEDLRSLLESVVALKDFLDHTAMLALPTQRSITFSPPVAMAH
uniref:Microneme/rhoptry antigen n=1 Tax=Anthurium amnicola TaxID=1678845 RepID=A0A1D1Y2V2_9ARAE